MSINIENKNFIQHTDIIDTINAELCNQTKSWKIIASQFALAQDQFGTDSDSFKAILKATGFHKSTANKLVVIGQSERTNDTRFDKLQAWTVLYDICCLSEEYYQKLLNKIDASDEKITSALVKGIMNTESTKDAFASLFDIRVDSNAMRTGRFTPSEYENVIELMNLIKAIPYIRIDRCNSFETIHDQYLKAINDNIENTWSKHRVDAIKKFKEAFIKANGPLEKGDAVLDNEVANLVELWKINKKEFFSICQYPMPSEAEVYEAAILKFETKRNKLISKIGDPFAHANTEFSCASSNPSSNN